MICDSIGLLVSNKEKRLGVATDLGMLTSDSETRALMLLFSKQIMIRDVIKEIPQLFKEKDSRPKVTFPMKKQPRSIAVNWRKDKNRYFSSFKSGEQLAQPGPKNH